MKSSWTKHLLTNLPFFHKSQRIATKQVLFHVTLSQHCHASFHISHQALKISFLLNKFQVSPSKTHISQTISFKMLPSSNKKSFFIIKKLVVSKQNLTSQTNHTTNPISSTLHWNPSPMAILAILPFSSSKWLQRPRSARRSQGLNVPRWGSSNLDDSRSHSTLRSSWPIDFCVVV